MIESSDYRLMTTKSDPKENKSQDYKEQIELWQNKSQAAERK